MVCLALAATPGWIAAQPSLSLSNAVAGPAQTVPLSLSLEAAPGPQPASVQWTLTYPTATVVAIAVTATSANKDVTCAAGAGTYSCILSGVNNTTISDGVIARVSVSLTQATGGSLSIGLSNVIGAAPDASEIPLTGSGDSIFIVDSMSASGLSCLPTSLASGGTTTCTVTISEPAPSGGVSLPLSSSNTLLTLPGSVSVLSGATSAVFTAIAGNINAVQVATVMASLSGTWVSSSITLDAPTVTSLACNPTTIGSATASSCVVTVSEPVSEEAGLPVSMVVDNTALKAPATVTVPVGATTTAFTLTSGSIAARQTATVTAMLNGTTAATNLTLVTAPAISALSCSPAVVASHGATTCTVTLSDAAAPGGTAVMFAASDSSLNVPPSVTVAAGLKTGTITVTIGDVSAQKPVILTAMLNGTQSTTLTLVSDGPPATYYFPHLGLGSGFQTVLTYVNYSNFSVSCQTSFFSDAGAPLYVPFGGTPVATRTDTLAPGTSIHAESQANENAPPMSGWAQGACDGPVKASIAFRYYQQGVAVGEAGVAGSTSPTTKFASFANSLTAVAYANPSTTDSATITITALDGPTGLLVGSPQTITLGPSSHGSSVVGQLLNQSSFSGSVQITSTAPIVVLALNADQFPVFSSLPPADLDPSTVLAAGDGNGPPAGPSNSYTYYFPHLALGSGFQTILTYVNYSAQNVSCQTQFFADSGLAPLPRLDALAPGGSIHQEIQTNATTAVSGWALGSCSGPVKASVVFRLYSQGSAVAEAGINASTAPATKFATFGEIHTGIAYANPSFQLQANITITAVDGVSGRSLARTTIALAPGAHGSGNLNSLLQLTSFTGWIEITADSPIVSLSLNAEDYPVFSSLPAGDLDPATILAVP